MFVVVTVPLWLGGAVAAAMAGMNLKDLHQQANASLQPVSPNGRETPTGG